MEDMLSLDSLGNLYQEDRQEGIGGLGMCLPASTVLASFAR